MGSIKLSEPLVASQVRSYHKDHYASSTASYYSDSGKAQGQWFGVLAEQFGLRGGVTQEAFDRLADGQHPFTAEQLVEWRTPAATGPAWIEDRTAWSQHLTDLYVKALESGTDVLTAQREPTLQKITRTTPKLEPVQLSERQKTLVEMHALAAKLYRDNLLSSAGIEARFYLARRGVSGEAIKEFGLGLSIAHPEPSALGLSGGKSLYSVLGKYGEDLMLASGLFTRGPNGQLRETFRDRLMFPIQDASGNVIAFGGRQLDDNAWGPKYLNSPETELFRKGHQLYNLHRAAKATKRAGKITLVEGYLDVIAAHQAGVKNVVGSLGTAFTEEQAELLQRLAPTAVLNLDSDQAGRDATKRAIEILLPTGMPVRVVTLSGAKDAAKMMELERLATYREAVAHAGALIPWLTEYAYAKQGVDPTDPFEVGGAKASAVRQVIQTLESAAPALREPLARELAAHLGLPDPEMKAPEKRREHRAAFDFTFAPHKSITAAALVGGDQRLVDAHESAVRIAMRAAELYTQARLSFNATANTENLVAAIFTHDTARPVGGVPDPHLHSHVVVFNMTNADGEIYAVQPLEWYRLQRYLDAVYQAEMAVRVQELGYTLERNLDTSYAAVAGYSKEYLDSISRRTQQIEELKKQLDIYGAKADQIIAHQTREAKVDWSRQRVGEYHREQARAYGLDPDAVPSAAKSAPSRTVEPTGAHAALTFAKHTLIERTAVFDQYELMEQALRYGLGHLRLHNVEQALEARKDEFVTVDHWRAHAPGERYTTPGMLTLEREVMESVAAGRNAAQAFAPGITKDDFRSSFQDRLNNAQMRLAYNVLTCQDRVFAIQGGAGTGKTTALAPIRELIEQQGYEVYGVAPTSRAASELAEAGITNAQTLQRFLALPVAQPHAKPRVLIVDESSLASTKQIHALLAKLRPEDRVVLAGDVRQHQSVEAGRIFEQLQQAGMSTFHLNKIMRQKNAPELLEAVKEFSKGQVLDGLRMLDEQGRIKEFPTQSLRFEAFAERYALSPANTTGVAPDNESVNALNSVVRSRLQAEGHVAATGFTARTLRNRQDLTAESKQCAWAYEPGNVVRFAKRNSALGVAAGDYATVESIQRDANTITVRIDTCDITRSITYAPADVQGVQVFRPEEREFSLGDRVQFTQPWKARRVDNRDFAEITALDAHGNARLKLDKTGERTVSFNLRDMPHLDYGYVVTSYAIQGASRENILIHVAAEDTRARTMVDKVFANVAVSRAKMDCVIYCDSKEQLGPCLDRLNLKPKAHSYEQIKEYAAVKDYTKEHTAA